MQHSTRRRRGVAALAAFALALDPIGPPLAGAQTAPAQPGKSIAAPAAATTPPPVDGGWPRSYPMASGGSVLVYQPQISTWEKQAHMIAFSAAAYRPTATDKPV